MIPATHISEREARGIFPLQLKVFSDSRVQDRTIFAYVTSLTAFIMFIALTVDLLVGASKQMMSFELVAVTGGLVLISAVWVLIPVFLKHRFAYWAGFIAYVFAVLALGYFFAFSKDPFSLTTGLQILPVLTLYLGWFWRQSISRATFVLSLLILVLALIHSAHVGDGRAVSLSNVVLSLLVMTFAFIVGSYLRWQHEQKANTDPLTGILNRRGALARLRVEMIRANTSGDPLSVAVIDFDHFKQLNDTKGHAFGDRVLQETVNYWRSKLRQYDVLGRTGGDEFVILFPKTTSDIADEVLIRLSEGSPHNWTWGVTQYRTGEDLETLFLRADSRLYKWKARREKYKKRSKPNSGPLDLYNSSPSRIVSFFENLSERQSEFSLVSVGVGLVMFITAAVAMGVGETKALTVIGATIVFGVLLAGAATVLVPLVIGKHYPKVMSLILAGAIFTTGIIVVLLVSNFSDGFSVFLFSSLIAMYLGAFMGTITARLLTLAGLTVISSFTLARFYPLAGPDDRIVLLTAVIYSYVICWYLFEVSSFLYWRSSTRIYHDSLTGALNRFGIREFGEAEVQRAHRTHDRLTVAVIDFVDFKRVNDRYGHAAGDALLRDTVSHFRSALNLYDLILRTGGDEFALILPYRTAAQAKQILENLEATSPHPWVAGTAEIQAGDTIDSLLKRADEDLYRKRGVDISRE